MSTVMPQDVLLRVGYSRSGLLVVSGPGRGPIETVETFTRATVRRAFRDRDGNAKRAAAGKMATDWPTGLVDVNGNPYGGPLVEGARNQLVTDVENFGNWSLSGNPPTRTSGQTDPFGGTGAYLIADDNAAAQESIFQTVTFTGDGTKCCAFRIRQGSLAANDMQLFDNTAGTSRHRIRATWGGGTPTLSSIFGAGALFTPVSIGGGWWDVAFGVNSVVAANTNHLYYIPGTTTSADVGDGYVFGANAWNSPFPSSYQAPGEATGVADALTSPFNFGPQSDLTILVRLGRLQHADAGASTALGVSPGIFSFGAGTAPRIGAYFDPAARNIIGVIDTATTDQTISAAIPAGNPTVCFQFKNLTTGGQVALDVGSGLSAFSSAATAFSAFSSQTLRIGRYDDELYGVIGDMLVLRGLFTRAEALAAL